MEIDLKKQLEEVKEEYLREIERINKEKDDKIEKLMKEYDQKKIEDLRNQINDLK